MDISMNESRPEFPVDLVHAQTQASEQNVRRQDVRLSGHCGDTESANELKKPRYGIVHCGLQKWVLPGAAMRYPRPHAGEGSADFSDRR